MTLRQHIFRIISMLSISLNAQYLMCYPMGLYVSTLHAICRACKAYLKILPKLKFNNFPQYHFPGQCFSATATVPARNYIILFTKFSTTTTNHHHTVQVAQVQVQYLRQWLDEKAPPAQVAKGEPPRVQVDYLR